MIIKTTFMGRGMTYILSVMCLIFFLWAATGSDDSSSSTSGPSESEYVKPQPPVFDNGVETDESTNIDDNTVFYNEVDEDDEAE